MSRRTKLAKLTLLEKKYRWLIADRVDQETLYEIQQTVAEIMAELAMETGTPIEKDFPYLFNGVETS